MVQTNARSSATKQGQVEKQRLKRQIASDLSPPTYWQSLSSFKWVSASGCPGCRTRKLWSGRSAKRCPSQSWGCRVRGFPQPDGLRHRCGCEYSRCPHLFAYVGARTDMRIARTERHVLGAYAQCQVGAHTQRGIVDIQRDPLVVARFERDTCLGFRPTQSDPRCAGPFRAGMWHTKTQACGC